MIQDVYHEFKKSHDELIQEIKYNGTSRGRNRAGTEETVIKEKITKFPEAQERLESSYQLCNWEKIIKIIPAQKIFLEFPYSGRNFWWLPIKLLFENIHFQNTMTQHRQSFAAKITVTQVLYIHPKITYVQEQQRNILRDGRNQKVNYQCATLGNINQ